MSSKLFVAVLGARVSDSVLEQHKVIFCVCQNLEELKLKAKESWIGALHLHIDTYICIEQINGYEVLIQDDCWFQVEVPENDDGKELFFVNLGGYKAGRPSEMPNEIHKQIFVIATSPEEAKEQAKLDVFFKDNKMLREKHCKPHVDDVVSINKELEAQTYTIKLRKITDTSKIQASEPVITGSLKV